MLKITHMIFSSALILYVSRAVFNISLANSLLFAVFAGFMQYLIDALSHETVVAKGGVKIHRRTWFLHSPLGAIILAFAFALAIAFIMGVNSYVEFTTIFLLMSLSSFSHLLLDMPTEKGIYLWKRRLWNKRLASSNDFLLNLSFMFLGFLLMTLAIGSGF